MFSEKKNLVLFIMLIFVMSFSSVVLYADCDMFGMLSTYGYEIHELSQFGEPYPTCGGNDPYDYLWLPVGDEFLEYQTTQNSNGYGIIYYNCNDNSIQELWNSSDPNNQVFRSSNSTNYSEYNNAKYHIFNQQGYEQNATIVLGHARQASGGNSGIPDPHPFVWDYELVSDPDEPCYTFEHNGTIRSPYIEQLDSMIEGLFPTWFTDMGFFYKTEQIGNYQIVDSERYFHWIIANIKYCDGNVLLGLHNAVKEMRTWNNCEKNFVFSDGEAMYSFRDYGDATASSYYLCYYDGLEEDDNPFRSVRTDSDYSSGLEEIIDDELVYIPRQGDIIRYENFNNTNHEISGIVSGTWSSNNSPYYVVGDIIVNDELTIESGVEVFFLDECEFTINGQVNLMNGSEFNLSHASSVNINGSDAKLFLDWGSTITGFTPTTYVEELVIPGDRIIAKNGGRITTDNPDNLQPGDPVITISSTLGELWDGIYINNPDHEEDFWFVNCDISGISNLVIGSTPDAANVVANLNLYLTDFTDAGQIVARQGHNLLISGESAFNRCNISYNYKTPIVVYDSPVYIDWALIEDNGRDINGGLLNSFCDGIHLNYSASLGSEILNTIIQGNTGCGIETYGQYVNIDNNTIQLNEQHGLLTKTGTFLDLTNNTILNNLYAEYVSVQNSYNWAEEGNTIQDLDGNAGGNDQYILKAYQWDGIEQSINVRGNDINHQNNERRFFPRYEAFRFDTGEVSPEREMLYSALDEMQNENYTAAETIFQQIITIYPNTNEAATSIRGLLFIENYTDQDYAALRSYIDNIQIGEDTSLFKAKEDVKTKSYMKDMDYLTAIDRLETIINNSQIPDEVVMAMIDEGYCYMELAEGGDRGLPVNCTVKTATFDDYRAKVRELESQFSFYLEEDDQNTTPIAGNILSLTNFPNPFNPTTTISFDLASESDVSIIVYNVKGQKVKQLINEQLSIGQHSIEWDGKDSNNKSIASGIYFYKISAGKSTSMKKMLLLK
ncbi:MAG: T9SS type A sorting domain-containing protein [Candidatus Tenebribacter mawsonii]|nr:T9SS type A sorting domain-containing protein [Candidatus Tenebribacter mawsonii]